MTEEELKIVTGQELIEQRDYCGVDNYYRDYLDNVNAEMLKRFNRLTELETENEQLKQQIELYKEMLNRNPCVRIPDWHCSDCLEENTKLKQLIEKYRKAVDKCLHITFMGGGCEVHSVPEYARLVDSYLTEVEGLTFWKN